MPHRMEKGWELLPYHIGPVGNLHMRSYVDCNVLMHPSRPLSLLGLIQNRIWKTLAPCLYLKALTRIRRDLSELSFTAQHP